LNADTVAVKLACVALGCTITDEGTVTSALLLDTFTVNPPTGAGPLSVSVHATEPALVKAAALHATADREVPVPLRLTIAAGFVEELLAMLRVPLAGPAEAGSN
jgi:hypothetical protein